MIQQRCPVVETESHLGVVSIMYLLNDHQRTLVESFCFRKFSLKEWPNGTYARRSGAADALMKVRRVGAMFDNIWPVIHPCSYLRILSPRYLCFDCQRLLLLPGMTILAFFERRQLLHRYIGAIGNLVHFHWLIASTLHAVRQQSY